MTTCGGKATVTGHTGQLGAGPMRKRGGRDLLNKKSLRFFLNFAFWAVPWLLKPLSDASF